MPRRFVVKVERKMAHKHSKFKRKEKKLQLFTKILGDFLGVLGGKIKIDYA